jgi:hypothetical protein
MPPDALEDTRWALEYVNLHGVSHLVSGRRIPEISFSQGRVTADDGVNLAEGTYDLGPSRFSVRVAAVTSLTYPVEALPEHDLFEHLSAARTAVVHGDFLHIGFGRPTADDHGAAGKGDDEPYRPGSSDELVYRWMEDEAPA